MVIRIVRALHLLLLLVGLVLSPVAHALKIQVNALSYLRSDNGGQLNHVGTLAPGATVEIPDKYAVMDTTGRVNAELTLNNWLRSSGYEQRDIDGSANGEQFDYFFPVRVASTPSYSGVNPIGNVYYMSLRSLARREGALVVQNFAEIYNGPEDDVPYQSNIRMPTAPQAQATAGALDAERGGDSQDVPPPPPPPTPEEEAAARTEAQPPCTNCSIAAPSNGAIASLRLAVQPALDRVKSVTETNRRRTIQTDAIAQTFRSSCGFDLPAFLPEIARAARAHNVPSRVLLAIMSQESMGDCHLRDNPPNKGLFQINPISKGIDVPLCTAFQKKTLLEIRDVRALRTGPQCLENPVINAFEAAKILRQKMDTVMNTLPKQSFAGNLNGYNSQAWRIAAASYNHGEAWVGDAYEDMKTYNARHRTNYQPTNWEDLKVFYLRSYLDRPTQMQQYGSYRANRASSRTIMNLGYAENIVPTYGSVAGRETNIEAWNRYLQANQVR